MVTRPVTEKPQSRGRKYPFKGKNYYVRDFCEETKIAPNIVYFRIKQAHTLEEIYRHYSPLCPKKERKLIQDRPLVKRKYRYQGKDWEAKELYRKYRISKSCFYEQIHVKGKSVEHVIENFSRLESAEARAMGFRRVGRQLKIRKTLENGIVVLDGLGGRDD